MGVGCAGWGKDRKDLTFSKGEQTGWKDKKKGKALISKCVHRSDGWKDGKEMKEVIIN